MLEFSAHAARAARALVVAAATAALTACGGGSSSSGNNAVPNTGGACPLDTQVQLAKPIQNSTGNGPVSSIEIVANGNNNAFATSYHQYDLIVTQSGSSPFNGLASNPLVTASDPQGYHPFNSDFYYSGALPTTVSGVFDVYLNAYNTGCTPDFIGSFSS